MHLVIVHQVRQLLRKLPGHRRLFLFGDRNSIRGGILIHDVAAERCQLGKLLLFIRSCQQDGHYGLRVCVVRQQLDIIRQPRRHQLRQELLHERELNARAQTRHSGELLDLQPLRHVGIGHHDLGVLKRIRIPPILQQKRLQLLRQILDPATVVDLQCHVILL